MTEATERDRYWLAHESAVKRSGKTAKEYAAEQGLSLHGFYQARKRLRALGHLARPGGKSEGKPKRGKPRSASFTKVEVLAPEAPVGALRIRLPSGLVVEGSGAEPVSGVAELVERLTQIR